MSDFSPCDYRAAQMINMLAYEHAHRWLFNCGDEKIAACSISRATRLSLVNCLYKWNTQKYTGNCHHLFSSWNQHCPRPKNVLLLWHSKRCMIVKYWFWKLKYSLLCITLLKEYSDKGLRERMGGKVCKALVCFWMELTGWSRKQKGKQFLISLIQILWFTLICCKTQSCLI